MLYTFSELVTKAGPADVCHNFNDHTPSGLSLPLTQIKELAHCFDVNAISFYAVVSFSLCRSISLSISLSLSLSLFLSFSLSLSLSLSLVFLLPSVSLMLDPAPEELFVLWRDVMRVCDNALMSM